MSEKPITVVALVEVIKPLAAADPPEAPVTAIPVRSNWNPATGNTLLYKTSILPTLRDSGDGAVELAPHPEIPDVAHIATSVSARLGIRPIVSVAIITTINNNASSLS